MIEAHVSAEIAALERTAGLVLLVAGDTGTARDLHRHAQDLVKELGRTTTWPKLGELRAAGEKLRAEALCYVQGVLLRVHDLDDGAGRAVDGLVAYLCRTAGVEPRVVVGVDAGSESFTRTLDLVRLPPYPDVWHLPVVAHELGHYVIRELRHAQDKDERPLRLLAAEVGDEELVADAYATYTVGPAYPLSCVWLRIDPRRVREPSPTHPSWQRRVHTMVSMLRLMSAKYDTGQYEAAVDLTILPAWERLTGSASTDADGGPVPARTMLTRLDRHLGGARYDVGSHVTEALDALAGGAPPGHGVTAAHLLNAAWSARLRGGDDPELNRRALALLAREG